MKKLISLILCILVLIPLSVGVFAAETPYINDQLGRVEEARLKELEEDAKELKTKYGIGIFLAYVKGHADDADVSAIVGDEKDYALLLLGERGTRILVGGKGAEIFSEADDRDRLGYVHDEQDEWDKGIARYLEVAEEYLMDAIPEETTTTTTTPVTEAPAVEKKGGWIGFAIPTVAAVIIAAVAIVFVSKKKV